MRSQLLRAAARSRTSLPAATTRSFTASARRPAEVELTIDGKKVSIEAGSALIQACEKAGVTIPRYCYHEYVAPSAVATGCLILTWRPAGNSRLLVIAVCVWSKSSEFPNLLPPAHGPYNPVWSSKPTPHSPTKQEKELWNFYWQTTRSIVPFVIKVDNVICRINQ